MDHYDNRYGNEDPADIPSIIKARAAKFKKVPGYYRQNRFAKQDQKDKLEELIANIHSQLSTITKVDTKRLHLEGKKIEHAIQIAQKVNVLKELLGKINGNLMKNRRISINRYMKEHFNKDVRRLDEYCAISRAVKAGADKHKLSYTHLIILGQGLHSKNQEKKKLTEKIIKTGTLPTGEPISETKSSMLAFNIKQSLAKNKSTIKYLQKINDSIAQIEKDIESLVLKLNKLNPIKRKKKDKLCAKASKLVTALKSTTEKMGDIHQQIVRLKNSKPDPVGSD